MRHFLHRYERGGSPAKPRVPTHLACRYRRSSLLTMPIDKASSAASVAAVPSTAFRFRLDPGSGVPTYLQLVQQVEQAMRLGYLNSGDQLPKVREVVADLAINPNTVLKAYRELETKGLTSGRPGQGTFIDGSLGQATLPQLAGLRRSLRGWLEQAVATGLDEEGIVALVTSTMRDFAERRDVSDGRGAPQGNRRAGGVA
jgi:GntR family transcriptional regulator